MTRALLLSLLAAAAGCSHVVRTYEGPTRPGSDVAHLFNTDEIRLAVLDDRTVEDIIPWRSSDSPQKHRYDLLPGDHRIAVQYYRDLVNSPYSHQWQESVNHVTLRHNFEAGKEYTFLVHTLTGPTDKKRKPGDPVAVGLWRPMLIDKSSGAIVAEPEGDLAAGSSPPPRPAGAPPAPQPYAPSPGPYATPAHPGGATITGVGQVQTKKLGLVTAAGREILLVPRTPRVYKWIDEELRHRKPGAKLWPFPPNTPDEAEDDDKVRKVLGYGDGQFIFEGVPLGEYLVVFEGDEPEVFATAEVSVHPGQTRIDNVCPAPPAPSGKAK